MRFRENFAMIVESFCFCDSKLMPDERVFFYVLQMLQSGRNGHLVPCHVVEESRLGPKQFAETVQAGF